LELWLIRVLRQVWPLYVERNQNSRQLNFDPPSLVCWSAWCPCVVHSKNKQRLQHLQTQGTPLPGGGEAYSSHCCMYGALDCLTGAGWTLQVCRDVDIMYTVLSNPGPLSFKNEPTFESAMVFVETRLAIAWNCGAATRAFSRRHAGKSSWRRTVSK
jgi:hypothetical protein